MKKLFASFLIVFSAAITTSVAAQQLTNAVASTYTFSTPEDAQRFSTLTDQTRCVVCQFQNIADSNAPLAASIRDKIYQLIQEKKSDDEIKAYLVKRYGEVILLKPRLNPLTSILWFFPLLAIAVFVIILGRFYRRQSV